MKARKEPDLTTLRMVKSDLQYELTKTGSHSLSDEVVLQNIKKNLTKRKDTAEEYRKAGRTDLADKELSEAEFIATYLPPMVPESEIREIIEKSIQELGASSPSDTGKVMGKVMANFKGKNIDGSLVSSLVKEILSSK